MKDLIRFIKSTWWLFLVLFTAPFIVISVFAILEYLFHRIDLSAGDWASLLGNMFIYWGTVILGIIAFWQNERAQNNNDALILYEKRKMSPVFAVKLLETDGLFSRMKFEITNCTNNIVCNFSLSSLVVNRMRDNKCFLVGTFPLDNQNNEFFIDAKEKVVAKYNTPQISIMGNERIKCIMCIFATDIIGQSKETTVEIVIDSKLICKYNYILNDL